MRRIVGNRGRRLKLYGHFGKSLDNNEHEKRRNPEAFRPPGR
jgi:hypothetical protein